MARSLPFEPRWLAAVVAVALLMSACTSSSVQIVDEQDAETPTPQSQEEPTPLTQPTATATAPPTSEPTAEPTTEPTAEPTTEPTAEPPELVVDDGLGLAALLVLEDFASQWNERERDPEIVSVDFGERMRNEPACAATAATDPNLDDGFDLPEGDSVRTEGPTFFVGENEVEQGIDEYRDQQAAIESIQVLHDIGYRQCVEAVAPSFFAEGAGANVTVDDVQVIDFLGPSPDRFALQIVVALTTNAGESFDVVQIITGDRIGTAVSSLNMSLVTEHGVVTGPEGPPGAAGIHDAANEKANSIFGE